MAHVTQREPFLTIDGLPAAQVDPDLMLACMIRSGDQEFVSINVPGPGAGWIGLIGVALLGRPGRRRRQSY